MTDPAEARDPGDLAASRRMPRGCLVALIGLAVVVVAVPVGLYFLIAWPYRDAESTLRAEQHRLRLSLGTLVSDEYRGGVCLDNCPEVEQRYRSADPCREIRHGVAVLAAHGYTPRRFGSHVRAWDHRHVDVMIDAGATCDGGPVGPRGPRWIVLSLGYRS